ncbi:MAG: GNAT family N-acetyltransferase [Acidimicrobiales bacterium]|nr:GNAT family N-acetyltransferase [Acidimicrobiales bacterium]
MVDISHRVPSVAEYRELRRRVGWKVPDEPDARRALDASAAAICATAEGQLVACGRIVGDAFYLFVVDLMVRPDHQGRGLGSRLLAELEAEASRRSGTGRLALVADRDVAPYYQERGYERSTGTLLEKDLGS